MCLIVQYPVLVGSQRFELVLKKHRILGVVEMAPIYENYIILYRCSSDIINTLLPETFWCNT